MWNFGNFQFFLFSKISNKKNEVKMLSFFLKYFWKCFFAKMKKKWSSFFFYCLDYVSRLQKNCSEYSGKLKHASAMDSVLKLSLKMMGNRWMFRRCSPIIYTCLPPEIHPHSQNATIIQEIMDISLSIMVHLLVNTKTLRTPIISWFRALSRLPSPYKHFRSEPRCSNHLPQHSGAGRSPLPER